MTSRSLSDFASEPPKNAVLFTEWLVVFSLLFTFFIAHGQFGMYSLQQTYFKHLVAVFLISACSMEYFGHRLFVRGGNHTQRLNTAPYWIWLCLLAIFIVFGSIYARSELKIRETFFINGFYILVGFAFSLILRKDNLDRLINTTFWITLFFSFFACIATIHARITGVLTINEALIHEREFFVIPLLYIVLVGNFVRGWFRWLVLMLIVAATGAALKNTPTIVLGLTLLLSYWRWWTSAKHVHRDASRKAVVTILVSALLVILLAAFAAYSHYVGSSTPEPNILFRQHQNRIAWKEFLDSPIIGNAFTGETGIYFNLWFDTKLGLRTLPTHNDVLDLLRAGGIVAFLLWFVALSLLYWRAFRLLRSVASKRAWEHKHDIVAWLLLVNVAAVIVYSLNPLLSKTAFASIVWINFAFLAASVTRLRDELVTKP